MITRMYKLFLIYSVVNLSSTSFCAPVSSKPCPPCPIKYHERIPPYILYILGFISLLLILVLITLIYVLMKTKFLKLKHTTPSTEKVVERYATCPTCQKQMTGTINLERNTSNLQSGNENTQTLKRQDSEVMITNDFNTLRSPKKTDATGNISPRIMKGGAKDLPYILPEQMSLICKEVLKRAKIDSTNSLHSIDKLVNEGKGLEETLSKCASTPVLDLYDTPTTPKSFSEKYTTAAEASVSSISKTDEGVKNSSTLANEEEDPDREIYDFPKDSNSIYDTLPTETAKVENVSGYITPCFENRPPSEHFKPKEEKQNYALIKDISSKQAFSYVKSECADNKINALEECEYDNPKDVHEKNKMYMNANDMKCDKLMNNI